jgi:hypothetical protein
VAVKSRSRQPPWHPRHRTADTWAKIKKLDVTIDDGKVTTFRARIDVSFKYEA